MVKKTYKMRFKTRQIVENGLTANKTKINIQKETERQATKPLLVYFCTFKL